jgi:hypothetical protein
VWLGGHLEGTISGSADIDYKQQCGDNSEASACLGLRGEISLSFGGHIEAVAGRLSLLKAGLEIGGRVGIAAKYCITYNSSEIKHWTTGSEIELENPVLFGSLNIGFFTKSFEWEASKENIDDLLHKVSRYFDW